VHRTVEALEAAKKEPLEGEKFSDAWFRGIASRINAKPESKPMVEIVAELNGYHDSRRDP
jgi:hypothetical protein